MHDDTSENVTPEWSAFKECLLHWRSYAVSAVVAVTTAVIICAGIPKTYSSQVKISDEHFESDLLIGLNNFAAWAKGAVSDHRGLRQPTVYYHLIGSPSFVEEMSHIRIATHDTDYYHYLLEHHRPSVWQRLWNAISGDRLTEKERIEGIIHDNIRSKVSTKYGTVLLQVTDQDPVVAAMVVDSVRQHLQGRLDEYTRTRYKRDLRAAIEKMDDSRQRFESARDEYTRFSDSHQDITSPAEESMEDHLMNEYDFAFSNYSRHIEQYMRAKAFVDKYSLKFIILKNATVAQKPSGPATIGYVLALLFLAFVVTTWWILGMRSYKESKIKR